MSDPPRRPVVVVTGGSRGIGAATCLLAAERGFDVAVGYVSDAAAGAAVVDRCRSDGAEAVAVQVDVSDESQVIALFDRTVEELGRVDALVNNAAVLYPLARVEDLTVERMRRTFEVNVFGAILCGREAVRRMSTARGGDGGAIVNISSGAARLGSPNAYVEYAAGKAALDTFTVGLAKEVALEGIRVNGVRPGYTLTEQHARIGEPDRMPELGPTIPMQRAGEPEEIATGIVWLLGEEASYVTGAILDITGGR
ncbi:MAG: SDR family oxidoreductase [Actinomycetota bacterium]